LLEDEDMPINTQTIGYRDGETERTGLLVWDDSLDHQRPGILVVHGAVQPHFPVAWHFRTVLLQLPGSASWPSGPMHVWVYMHQNKPSLQGGTVASRSASMKSPFQRSAEHRCG